MSTQYSNKLKFTNTWTLPLKGIWISYNNSGTGGRLFDNLFAEELQIGDSMMITPQSSPIISETGDTDYWTITILDSQNRLWGTGQQVSVNIPHTNGIINLDLITTPGKPIEFAQFTWPGPDSETSTTPMSRL